MFFFDVRLWRPLCGLRGVARDLLQNHPGGIILRGGFFASKPLCMTTKHILNLGAGVQSTMVALLHEFVPDAVPEFDCAIFADTQEEPRPVYDHLQWLVGRVPYPVLIRTRGSLGNELLHGIEGDDDTSRIPAWLASQEGVKEGMGRRSCTYHFKILIIVQTIRRDVCGLARYQHMPRDLKVHTYTGLSYEEGARIAKVNARAKPWQVFHHPLHELKITRPMAQRWLRDQVPHKVPRSACTFCPYRRDEEWLDLIESDPAGFERACVIDDGLRTGAACAERLIMKQYIHRSCVPLRSVKFVRGEQPKEFAFAGECMGMCGL